MSNKITAVTFIRDNMAGGFCLFESMASLLPFVTDMVVLDLGSRDGTYKILKQIGDANPRVRIEQGSFTRVDASAFADAANQCVSLATHDNVLFWQADEIWHESLLLRMRDEFEQGHFDLNFWRVQLKYNFQRIKWFPHPVHRVGPKANFVFFDDGMNTERRWGVPICSEYDMGWFIKWGTEFETRPVELPTYDMILDVSQVGAFIDNIVDKRKMHSPFWHEKDVIEQIPAGRWYKEQRSNPDWDKTDTPFNIPRIMRRHLGRRRYVLDQDILDALRSDETHKLLGVNL